MYIVETRIKTRGNKTIWMPYKQYRTTNGIENFQKRHQYLFDAGELRVTGNAEPRRSHIKSGEGMLRVGDILHESYGYGMTINKFYEVIALSPSGKTCTIQPIRKITIKGDAYSPYGFRSGAPDRGRGSFLWRAEEGQTHPDWNLCEGSRVRQDLLLRRCVQDGRKGLRARVLREPLGLVISSCLLY